MSETRTGEKLSRYVNECTERINFYVKHYQFKYFTSEISCITQTFFYLLYHIKTSLSLFS